MNVTRVNLVVAVVHDSVCAGFTMPGSAVQDHLRFHSPKTRLTQLVMIDRGAAGNLTVTQSMSTARGSSTNAVHPIATMTQKSQQLR